jgi:hypothetical protein
VSNSVATGEDCDCSGNICTDAEFCYDGVCNTDAQKRKFLVSISFMNKRLIKQKLGHKIIHPEKNSFHDYNAHRWVNSGESLIL